MKKLEPSSSRKLEQFPCLGDEKVFDPKSKACMACPETIKCRAAVKLLEKHNLEEGDVNSSWDPNGS